MPRGGARVNSGPAPDPNALRRDRPSDRDGWTELPAAGFDGETPKWPLCALDDGLSDRESALWASAWRTPQAAEWFRLGWTLEIGLYVRLMVLAEAGDVKAASELRQWSDRLGLNPAAMMRNRWRVGRSVAAAPVEAASEASSFRSRLKVVPDDAVG